MPSATSAGNLNERQPPTFTVTRTASNAAAIQFSEPVTAVGGGALAASDFVGTLDGATVSSGSLSDGGSNLYTLNLGLGSPAAGGETVTVDVGAGNVIDANGVVAASNQQSFTLLDKTPPTFTASVQSGGAAVAVEFSEPVVAVAGGGALTLGAQLTATISGGTATKGGSAAASGSGSSWTINLDLQGTKDGSEQVTVDVVAAAVADAAGNQVAQNAQTMTLVDLVPTFTIAVRSSDNAIVVTFSEAVTDSSGGALVASDFSVSVAGGAASLGSITFSSTSTSVRTLCGVCVQVARGPVLSNPVLLGHRCRSMCWLWRGRLRRAVARR